MRILILCLVLTGCGYEERAARNKAIKANNAISKIEIYERCMDLPGCSLTADDYWFYKTQGSVELDRTKS